MITQFYLYILANNNLKGNLWTWIKYFAMDVMRMTRLAHWKLYMMAENTLNTCTDIPSLWWKDLSWQYHGMHLQSEMKIQYELQKAERLLLNHKRCQDSWPPEKSSIQGQWRSLIAQRFCVIKFYKTTKEIEKAADVDIRRGKKEYPLLAFSQMLYSH